MGLSVKWANCNLGATRPEDYGDHFSWGEIQPKSKYKENNYKYGKKGVYTDIGTDISGTIYDAARQRLGGGWRMPTMKEVNELLSNCIYVDTIINEVRGICYKAMNDEQIFFPYSGIYHENYKGKADPQVNNGQYWTSSCKEGSGKSAQIFGGHGGAEIYGETLRSAGLSIRPVIDRAADEQIPHPKVNNVTPANIDLVLWFAQRGNTFAKRLLSTQEINMNATIDNLFLLKYYGELAEKGNTKAKIFLTNYNPNTIVTIENLDFMTALANLGNIHAKDQLANQMTSDEITPDNILYFKTLAKAGNYDALKRLAKFYTDEDNKNEAINLYKEAAMAGNVAAMLEMGRLSKNRYDDSEELNWYEKAYEKGSEEAREWLKKKYYDWGKKEKDLGKKMQHYYKSATYGNDDGVFQLAKLAIRHQPYPQSGIIDLLKATADKGHAGCCRLLGWCYETGMGVQKDYGKMIKYTRMAAEAGDNRAINNLAVYYYFGIGVAQNVHTAINWAQKINSYADPTMSRLIYNMKRGSQSMDEIYSTYVDFNEIRP